MEHENYQAFKELIEQNIPFNNFLGMRLHILEKGRCALALPFREELVGDFRRNALHGGVVSTLVDTCGGFTVWTMCDINDKIATIDMRVDYLKPTPAGKTIIAESTIKLLGNRVGNTHTVVYAEDSPRRILAEGRSVYNIRRAGLGK